MVLEVLAGGRTPSDAATVLGTSLPRYYAIEAKALGGLVVACEPTTPGKKRTSEAELSAVKKDLERAKREAARYQALVRAGCPRSGPADDRPGASLGAEAEGEREAPQARGAREAGRCVP